jgi:predicted regulator of Ras-like GTPase activity (Roadblock/LC7/MglB family)
MSEENSNMQELKTEINELIKKNLEENNAIIGIFCGTHGGVLIASEFKQDIKLKWGEITAANSSMLFLSSKLLKNSLNQEISYDLIVGKNKIIISILTNSITLIAYLNRELAELEGISKYSTSLKKFALKISAMVETSDILKEEIFVKLKLAIPNALIIAIITKDGMPIRVQSTMAEPMLSAMLSAINSLFNILLFEERHEYSIISGAGGSIIVHELDESRILCVAVPEGKDTKIKSYVAKIKSLI